MRVVHVASEVAPFAQSGGLADVLGGLPPALAAQGLEVGVLMPLYPGVASKVASLTGKPLEHGTPLSVVIGPHTFDASLRTARVRGVTIGFVDCAPLYDRPGGLYGPTGSSDWSDNHLRFALLGKVAAEHGALLVGNAPPDVLHAHDWQASTAAIYATLGPQPSIIALPDRAAIVTTIHNLAYRGIFPKHVMDELGWPWSRFTVHDIEFYDQVSFLKGGMSSADVVTTVSPSYASEIRTPAFGEALDGFVTADVKRLVGIVNGIDTDTWNPATDSSLPALFDASSLPKKAICRAAIAAELGLDLAPHQPLIAVIARMTGQKGLDLVADIIPELHHLDAKLVILGSGESDLESRFSWLGDVFKEQVAVRIGFDINLSRRIYAGSDFFLMPSRFEPCGLGQLYAMRYGTIPIVHAVGGLRDTVVDAGNIAPVVGAAFKPSAKKQRIPNVTGTGFVFTNPTPLALFTAIERGCRWFRTPHAFDALRKTAMARDSSWTVSANEYVQLYRSLRT